MSNKQNKTAEELAKEFERGDFEVGHGSGGKRSKAEKVEHKHPHPEGDTRRIGKNFKFTVNNI